MPITPPVLAEAKTHLTIRTRKYCVNVGILQQIYYIRIRSNWPSSLIYLLKFPAFLDEILLFRIGRPVFYLLVFSAKI